MQRSRSEQASRCVHWGALGHAMLLGLALLLAAGTAEARGKRGGHEIGQRTDAKLRSALRRAGVEPIRNRDYARHPEAQVELGQMLFFDKELSGNRDVSCATCHHPLAATGDGLSLPAGVGGAGLATTRVMGAGRERVPRNAPEVWNRGHVDFRSMFWDSRLAEDPSEPSGFVNPAGDDLPPGLPSALAAQAMFPVTSAAEMRGDPGENEIADAPDNPAVWAALMERLLTIEEYRDLFAAAFPSVEEVDLGFEHAATAIAAFEATAWRADRSPFDAYLRGDDDALSLAQKRGALLFYGEADCAGCHAGALQTDLEHHAIAAPQIGPGKGDGPDGDEDLGRARETGDPADAYRFRTPSLRNVALNAPYLHAGAYPDLAGVVRHHLRPRRALARWDETNATLPLHPDEPDDFGVMNATEKVSRIADANELRGQRLSRDEFRDLLAFLHALTDPTSLDIRRDVPRSVPSGLPVFD